MSAVTDVANDAVSGREKSDADDPLKNQHAIDLVYYYYCYGGSVFVTL